MLSGGGEGEHGCKAQDHPPATIRSDEDALPHSTPPLPDIAAVASQEKRQRHEHEQQQQAASLPEAPLVEILARVPYKSLCRFKCVSKPWLALCSSRDILKRSPQTLSGFFYHDHSGTPNNFRNLSGRGPPLVDPSLPFLSEIYAHISVDQVCGGLLLCSCRKTRDMQDKTDYVVCNPLTEEWTVLPPIVYPDEEFDEIFNRVSEPYLGFDAAVPSRFVVFTPLTIGGNDYGEVAIYSSETGQWSYVQSKWASETPVELDPIRATGVFLNGSMHWSAAPTSIVAVDSEGKVWRVIKVPDDLPDISAPVSIGQSQGRLYAWQIDTDGQLCIWVLEDYSTGKWTVKRTVKILELFGKRYEDVGSFYAYAMFAVHPDCNVIFLEGEDSTVSYDLDNDKVDVICTDYLYGTPLPYTPCFAELPSAGH